jgi:sulfate transport system substrate-binding protein
MDSSGRQSMATFERGTGDAVVTYENELLLQRKRTGAEVAYITPPATLLIEGPAALVETSIARHGNRPVAEALLAFLRTAEAQAILASYGFRPLDPAREKEIPGLAHLPPHLFTMRDLGGWKKINKDVYGPGGVWDSLFTQRGHSNTLTPKQGR